VTPNDQTANDFPTALRHSLLRQNTYKSHCPTCNHLTTFSSQRSIPTRDLPPLLAINACVSSEDKLKSWLDFRHQRFLKPKMDIHGPIEGVDDPQTAPYEVRVRAPDPLSLHAQVNVPLGYGRADCIKGKVFTSSCHR